MVANNIKDFRPLVAERLAQGRVRILADARQRASTTSNLPRLTQAIGSPVSEGLPSDDLPRPGNYPERSSQ